VADSILRNEPTLEPSRISSRHKRVVEGAVAAQSSYRSGLQRRITEFLGLDAGTKSGVCVTSGTNAVRAALKVAIGVDRSATHNEVIVLALTTVSTAEAVLMEVFVLIIVDVDPRFVDAIARGYGAGRLSKDCRNCDR